MCGGGGRGISNEVCALPPFHLSIIAAVGIRQLTANSSNDDYIAQLHVDVTFQVTLTVVIYRALSGRGSNPGLQCFLSN